MASLISGFEYDIFISYRQNDNRSGWVTGFAEALKMELAATIKEPVSVYFDLNQQDGLLENHNVDKSLERKLKCLIFIPVVSHTYCDPDCFAWKNEFLSFIKSANEDSFGRDVQLSNGNVASRILPVKIHNLDEEDTKLLENELGGVIRSIEFIYREAGVNRPLGPADSVKENMNKTQFNNQVNKLANAIKDITEGLKKSDNKDKTDHNIINSVGSPPDSMRSGNRRMKKILWPILVFVLIAAGFFLLHRQNKVASDTVDKSIAVLPLENMSSDPAQEYFSEGMMQEILNHLFKIGGLRIPSGTSSMRFKGSKFPVSEIARELGVAFVLEGNVSVSGNNVRVIVRLINGRNEQLLWSEDYKRTMTAIDLLDIQSDVAQKVADNLKVVLNPEVKKRITARPTENTEAYLLFLQALVGQGQIENAELLLEKAIKLDPGFADAYATLAFFALIQGNDLYGKLNRIQVLEKTEPLLQKALQLDENSVMAHTYMASVDLWYNWDFESVGREYQIVNRLNPSSSEVYLEFVQYLLIIGKFQEALNISELSLNEHDLTGNKYVTRALAYCYSGQKEKALEEVDTYMKTFQNDNFLIYNSMRIYVSFGQYEKAIGLYEKNLGNRPVKDLSASFIGYLGIAFFKTGNKRQSAEFINELTSRALKTDIGSAYYFAATIYAAMDDKEKAMQALQNAFTAHEEDMVWLKVDPLFFSLHGDPRYENLIQKIGLK